MVNENEAEKEKATEPFIIAKTYELHFLEMAYTKQQTDLTILKKAHEKAIS